MFAASTGLKASDMGTSSIDPLKIFVHARQFLNTSHYLMHKNDVELFAQVGEPVIVLSAFASELYLKCLVAIETGNAPRGHDLFELFQNLNAATQKQVSVLWDKSIITEEKLLAENEKLSGKSIPRDLIGALNVCRKSI
jgi:HEPN domain-containing protein